MHPVFDFLTTFNDLQIENVSTIKLGTIGITVGATNLVFELLMTYSDL